MLHFFSPESSHLYDPIVAFSRFHGCRWSATEQVRHSLGGGSPGAIVLTRGDVTSFAIVSLHLYLVSRDDSGTSWPLQLVLVARQVGTMYLAYQSLSLAFVGLPSMAAVRRRKLLSLTVVLVQPPASISANYMVSYDVRFEEQYLLTGTIINTNKNN